ncbi:MAG: hypothetical protein AAF999_08405 [Pseudomonadota bacterium]
MDKSNKILTVSYGAFSCTLEGFDDSFGAMKAIAEYFRDLAADDRYFGAEPPQPDADLLARIAEREAARRVDAREHEGRIMLKARQDPGAPAVIAEGMSDPARERAEVSRNHAARSDPAHRGSDEGAGVDLPETPDGVDLKQRNRVCTYIGTDRDESLLKGNPPHSDDTPVAVSALTEAQQETASEGETGNVAPFHSRRQLAEVGEDISETQRAVPTSQAEKSPGAVERFEIEDNETPHPTFGNDSIDERLQRIRAVVSERMETSEVAENVDGTETPDRVNVPDDCQEAMAEPSVTGAEEEVMAEEAAEDSSVVPEPGEVKEAAGEEDELDALLRQIEAEDETVEDAEPVGSDHGFEEGLEPVENSVAAVDQRENPPEEEPGVHGRVLKVNRADLEAALEAGDLQDVDAPAVSVFADEDKLLLSQEMEVTGNVTAEMPEPPTRENQSKIDSDPGQEFSRLMAKVDRQMQEPESKTRRNAFAHLRAAVAARVADHSINDPDAATEETTEAFRNDLAEAVKPRRPITKSRTDSQPDARPGPLKLVSAQRVDPDPGMQRGPVAPRRVAAADDHDKAPSEDTGFSNYAQERGAESLTELLEAAAAYLSLVEGHEQFSRPQLMSRVRQANGGEFTREDGLRAFGQLLRSGKIEKISGGRFTVSEAVGFRPDHRAAG